jgi:hypothetical protein
MDPLYLGDGGQGSDVRKGSGRGKWDHVEADAQHGAAHSRGGKEYRWYGGVPGEACVGKWAPDKFKHFELGYVGTGGKVKGKRLRLWSV